MLIYVPINPTILLFDEHIRNYLRYAISITVMRHTSVCVQVEDVECVTTAARYCVCYPHQNTLRTYSKRLWIQYVPFFVMLLDIFTSGKCHQNFRFATSYPGIKYFAKMCTMWQPCIVRYQRGFPGFQDSMKSIWMWDSQIKRTENLAFANADSTISAVWRTR